MDSNSKPPESVGDLLGRYSGGVARPGLRNLGIRLGEEDHIRLDMVAAHFGVPKATFARDLLRAALSEAWTSMHFDDPEDAEDFHREYEERMIDLHEERQGR
ncbi:MAG: hypothetical protein M3P49_00345 [Actinomycetota bacterium]|nr:hypothetical protein [Actinomycetota bacterium]